MKTKPINPPLSSDEASGYKLKFYAVLFLFTVYRLWYAHAGILELVGDEAHYWEWSRNLGINYYSKGPVVAYIISFFTYLGGDTPLFVRLGAIVTSVLFALVAYKFSLELFSSHKAAFYTVLVFEVMPIFFAGGMFMTIDPPFILCWLCSLFLIFKGIKYGDRKYWVLLGLCTGVGFLTKYTMFLIYPLLWIYLLKNRDKAEGRAKDILLAHGISLFFVLAPLIWNANNGWANFRHVFGQVQGKGFSINPLHFIAFIGSQVGVISPLFFVGILITYASYYFLWGNRDFELDFLFWFSAPVLGVFVVRSLFGKVQANWPAPAYVAAVFAMVAIYFGRLPLKKDKFPLLRFFERKWAVRAFAVSALIISVGSFPNMLEPVVLPFAREGKSLTSRISGWDELGKHVEKIMGDDTAFIFSDSYQVTSELAFYVKTRPPTFCLNLGRRQNQYDYWPSFENFIGKNGIFIKEARPKFRLKPRLLNAFKEVVPLKTLVLKRWGYVFKKFYIYRCTDLLGFEKINSKKMDF